MNPLWRSLVRARGVTTAETMILLVLVAMVVMASIKMLQGTIGDKVDEANGAVASVSTESDEDRKLRESRKAFDNQRSATASSGESANHSQDKVGSKSGAQAAAAPQNARSNGSPTRVGAQATPADEGCGGFNPFLIPIVLGLMGLLGYVIAKTKKG